MNTCLLGLETNVDRFTGALEGFLGRIQIDDGLRLVRDDRRIGLVSGDTVNVIDIDSTVSEPDRVGILMDISDDEAPSDHPIFVAGISTPSDTMGAVRMEMPTSQGQPPSELGNALPVPAPPAAAPEAGPAPQAAASGSQAPSPSIPPPTFNLIPATPQTSQEKATAVHSDPSPTLPARAEPAPEPSPTRLADPQEPTRPPNGEPDRAPSQAPTRAPSRAPSRTPAGTLGLPKPMTRSQSRSKTPK
jgi:hypothetical protein